MVGNGTMNGKPKRASSLVSKVSRVEVEELQLDRLVASMRRSRQALEFFRSSRREAVKESVGRRWSRSGAEYEVPIGLIAKYVQIVSRSLVPKAPRIMLSTMRAEIGPAVDGMESWLARDLAKTYFEEKLRRFVTDALYSIGVMKVALGTPADEATSYGNKAGLPFAETIDLDDLAISMSETSLDKCSYIGHRYSMPVEEAQELGFFDKKARGSLQARDSWGFNEEGDTRIGTLNRGYVVSGDDDYEEMVDLWEVWLRRANKVVTFAASSGGGVPSGDLQVLKVQDWLGPACGPYHFLAFGIVPGNPMPFAPIMGLLPLHELVNRLYVKLGQQAERQKENLPVRGGQMDDAGRLQQAADGEMFACDNADNIQPVSHGGPSTLNLEFAGHIREIYNEQAGNLNLLAGTAAQSRTATQDKMLNENASAGVSDMQEMTVAAVSKIARAYCWYLWNHPELVMEVERQAPGVPEVKIQRRIYPGAMNMRPGANQRKGPFEDLDIRVDPYSLQHKSPMQRLAILDSTVKDMMPMMPLLQQQGVKFDVQAYLKIRAKYTDEPDIAKIFTIGTPESPVGGSGGSGIAQGRMPQNTSREYIRRSVGQDTTENKQNDFSNMLAAENANQGE